MAGIGRHASEEGVMKAQRIAGTPVAIAKNATGRLRRPVRMRKACAKSDQ
jgi:hypothetical protein